MPDKKIKTEKKKETLVTHMPSFLDDKKMRLLLVLGTIGVAAFSFKSILFAATVNGRPIFRTAVIQSLEKQGGGQVLEDLISKELVNQEAQKAKVSVEQTQIDAEISRIEDLLKNQGMTLDAALSANGQTRQELIENIRFQKTVEALISKDIQIADSEIKAYFDANKASLGKDATFENSKEKIKTSILQQKMAEKYNQWVSSLREKANVKFFVNYSLGI